MRSIANELGGVYSHSFGNSCKLKRCKNNKKSGLYPEYNKKTLSLQT